MLSFPTKLRRSGELEKISPPGLIPRLSTSLAPVPLVIYNPVIESKTGFPFFNIISLHLTYRIFLFESLVHTAGYSFSPFAWFPTYHLFVSSSYMTDSLSPLPNVEPTFLPWFFNSSKVNPL